MTQYLPDDTLARSIGDTLLNEKYTVETTVFERPRGKGTATVEISIGIDRSPFRTVDILDVASTLLARAEFHALRVKGFATPWLNTTTGILSVVATYPLPFGPAEKRPRTARASFLHDHALHSLVQVVAAGRVPYPAEKRQALHNFFPDPRTPAEIRSEQRRAAVREWLSNMRDMIPKRYRRDYSEYKSLGR